MTGDSKHFSNMYTHLFTQISEYMQQSHSCTLFAVQESLNTTHTYTTTQHIYTLHCPDTRTASGHVHTAGVPLCVIIKPPVASAADVQGSKAPRTWRQSVLERSAVVITHHFACSACYHQLRRGRHRKSSKFKA